MVLVISPAASYANPRLFAYALDAAKHACRSKPIPTGSLNNGESLSVNYAMVAASMS
jgi:hypothetical protein